MYTVYTTSLRWASAFIENIAFLVFRLVNYTKFVEDVHNKTSFTELILFLLQITDSLNCAAFPQLPSRKTTAEYCRLQYSSL